MAPLILELIEKNLTLKFIDFLDLVQPILSLFASGAFCFWLAVWEGVYLMRKSKLIDRGAAYK
jgi:hypothetical protein